MKYLLLGAGLQGTAIAHDLLKVAQGTTGLVAVDGNPDALAALADRLKDSRLETRQLDVRDNESMALAKAKVSRL